MVRRHIYQLPLTQPRTQQWETAGSRRVSPIVIVTRIALVEPYNLTAAAFFFSFSSVLHLIRFHSYRRRFPVVAESRFPPVRAAIKVKTWLIYRQRNDYRGHHARDAGTANVCGLDGRASKSSRIRARRFAAAETKRAYTMYVPRIKIFMTKIVWQTKINFTAKRSVDTHTHTHTLATRKNR